MRTRKSSLLASLVLALSLALSPVSAFAEDLDTPIHEDPIDEVQSNTTWIHRSLSVTRGGRPVTFTVHAYCDYSWTEGIGAQFNSVTISVTGVTYDGHSATLNGTSATNIDSYNIWGRARKTFYYVYNGVSFSFEITVLCDEYGDLSVSAS